MKAIVFICLFLVSYTVSATKDSGYISELYVSATGNIAVKLKDGFPEAVASNTCPTSSGWAGNTTADPAIKSALLSAKASGSLIIIAITGCDASNTWFKVVSVTIQ